MATPIKVTLKDRLKATADIWRGGGWEFYPGGRDDQRRYSNGQFAKDIADLMTEYRHRMLLGDARYIYQAFSNVSGMVRQKARYVYGGSWRLQSLSEDKDFAKAVEDDFNKIDRLINIRGTAFSFRRAVEVGSMSLDRDGDYLIILTEDPKTGFPLLQYIEAHRIGDWGNTREGFVTDGNYSGRRILSGIIVNDFGRPMAYRVKDGSSSNSYRDIPANDCIYVTDPEWFSQGRGTPTITAGILDWYDLAETRDAQKIKAKVNSMLTLVESNESGKQDAGRRAIGGLGGQGKLSSQYIDSGMIRVIKNGGSLKAHSANDPSSGWLEFTQTVEAGAFYAAGWRREMLDASKLGGATVRGFAADINKSIDARVEVLEPAQRKCALYIIAKRAKMGTYELPADWYRIAFTRPAEFTVDEGRMRAQDRDDLRAGLTTETAIISRRGGDFEETKRQRAKELAKTREIAEEFKLNPEDLGTLAMPGDPVQNENTDQNDNEA